MPGRDGTGPMGQGSMTGRGLGNCNPNGEVATNNAGIYGRGMGMGMGRRGMRNFGRGRFAGNNVNAVNQNNQNK